ncbi:MAG: hypothetical protein IJC39_00285, partial [Firmicutes bacterium]|nr:hypothetical protein [Bacillota bacterium]
MGARIYLRRLVERALINKAHSVIVAHNHPGGTPEFSMEDIFITYKIKSALKTVDILLTDHIVQCGSQCISMRQKGILEIEKKNISNMGKRKRFICKKAENGLVAESKTVKTGGGKIVHFENAKEMKVAAENEAIADLDDFFKTDIYRNLQRLKRYNEKRYNDKALKNNDKQAGKIDFDF